MVPVNMSERIASLGCYFFFVSPIVFVSLLVYNRKKVKWRSRIRSPYRNQRRYKRGMGRVVAISGGDLSTTEVINRYAVNMVTGSTKHVLFIGTASGDDQGYIDSMKRVFTGFGCEEVKALELTRKEYSEEGLRTLLEWADLIYVGGGDTIFMMNEWKKQGVDVLLREVYERDAAVLMGISAGAMCWFDSGCTDSELAYVKPGMTYGLTPELLGIYPMIFCPHYEDRVADFAELLKDKQENALALESNVAFVEENGKVYYIKSEESAKAYEFCYGNGSYEKKELEVKYIG